MTSSNKSEQFKSKGMNIIKNQRIDSMVDFLNGSSESRKDTHEAIQSPQNRSMDDTLPVNNKVAKTEKERQQGRLHIQIRQDLIEKLLETIFERKRNPKEKSGTTQRAIVEEALENYFKFK